MAQVFLFDIYLYICKLLSDSSNCIVKIIISRFLSVYNKTLGDIIW